MAGGWIARLPLSDAPCPLRSGSHGRQADRLASAVPSHVTPDLPPASPTAARLHASAPTGTAAPRRCHPAQPSLASFHGVPPAQWSSSLARRGRGRNGAPSGTTLLYARPAHMSSTAAPSLSLPLRLLELLGAHHGALPHKRLCRGECLPHTRQHTARWHLRCPGPSLATGRSPAPERVPATCCTHPILHRQHGQPLLSKSIKANRSHFSAQGRRGRGRGIHSRPEDGCP